MVILFKQKNWEQDKEVLPHSRIRHMGCYTLAYKTYNLAVVNVFEKIFLNQLKHNKNQST